MAEQTKVTTLEKVVIRFSGDSGDGMQLTGTIFSNLSAIFGNEISTFPDYPAEVRAPQGTLSGVSGFQVHLGSRKIFTPGDKADVLVAMNPAALKVNVKNLKPNAIVLIDTDSFQKSDLDKAQFTTDDPFQELGLGGVQVVAAPISTMVKAAWLNSAWITVCAPCKICSHWGWFVGCSNVRWMKRCTCCRTSSPKTPAIAQANIKALTDGYNYGHNIHASVSTYRIESKKAAPGFYTDVNGNKATSYGLIAAAEKAGLRLFLGSYPITPATDILHELSKHKELGVITVQAEDEIAGICTSIGASFAGCLAATSTSGPGLALKSEAIGLAVIAELPLVVIDVQRGGPSTGMPTKSEQTDLMQALYGRNGESPAVVIAASTPTDCFDAAYWAGKLALEHMTPVILLTDAFIANGSSAWKLPNLAEYPEIKPNYVSNYDASEKVWKAYRRDKESLVRYWAIPGTEGFAHRLGGLEKDYETSAISTDPVNHQKMVTTRQAKIDKIADYIPELEVIGDPDADLLIVGWGGTYGHLYEAMETMQEQGKKVALAHFKFISPLPKNTAEVLSKYKKVVVAEQNNGQFANYLRGKVTGFNPYRFNRVKGQPFVVARLVEEFTKILEA